MSQVHGASSSQAGGVCITFMSDNYYLPTDGSADPRIFVALLLPVFDNLPLFNVFRMQTWPPPAPLSCR